MNLRIRWSQAGLVLLVAVGVLLALRVVPSLLEPQEAPPVPADVGLPHVKAAPIKAAQHKPVRTRPRRKRHITYTAALAICLASTSTNVPAHPHRRHTQKLRKQPPPLRAPSQHQRLKLPPHRRPPLTTDRWSSPRIEGGCRVPLPAACTFSAVQSRPAACSPSKKLSRKGYPTPTPLPL
jgi:hypothetical protein